MAAVPPSTPTFPEGRGRFGENAWARQTRKSQEIGKSDDGRAGERRAAGSRAAHIRSAQFVRGKQRGASHLSQKRLYERGRMERVRRHVRKARLEVRPAAALLLLLLLLPPQVLWR